MVPLLLLPLLAAPPAAATIPIERYTLPNGLKVVLSEDHSAPVVTTWLTYRVGSAQEKQGLTGFAHLFEHMMFNGSKEVPEGAFSWYVDGTGGILNGNTEPDRTNYFETVPSNFLAGALWLEANRMASLEITEAALANEKDVVKEEVRQQQENQPYAKTILLDWPAKAFTSWEYSHSIYGSMEDLSNAPVQAFKDFFATHYVPNNTTLVIVGDFAPDRAKELVQRYFGGLARGPEPSAKFPAEAEQTAPVYEKRTDPLAPVPLALISFDIPPPRTPERDALDVLAAVLSDGPSARLNRVLVDEKKLAVACIMQAGFPIPTHGPGQLATLLVAAKDVDLETLRAAYWAEIDALVASGPTAAELQRAKAKLRKRFYDGFDSTLAKASELATYETFHGDATLFLKEKDRHAKVTSKDVREAAARYLARPRSVTFDIEPGGAAGLPGSGG